LFPKKIKVPLEVQHSKKWKYAHMPTAFFAFNRDDKFLCIGIVPRLAVHLTSKTPKLSAYNNRWPSSLSSQILQTIQAVMDTMRRLRAFLCV